MLHEAIFLATCNATNVALQVARKIALYNMALCLTFNSNFQLLQPSIS